MSTRSVTLAPAGGWDAFTRSPEVEELVWELLAGWHYMNPTSKTSVWESDTEATFYLAFGDDGRLVEAVAGYAEEDDPELDELCAKLRRRFAITDEA